MKKLLHWIPAILACLVLVLLLPQQASAASESDLTFTINSDGNSYSVTDCAASATGELEIPATVEGLPVTAIGNQAFRECAGLTGIRIPESVTSIGWEAFQNCTSLTEVNLPDGITDIQDFTFLGCTALTSITIPDSVTAIWLCAFSECTSLENIDFGNGVTMIGSDSFSSCASLKELVIPDSVVNIYEEAFAHNVNLSVVRMGLQVQYIAESAFYDCMALQDVYYEGTQKEWDAIAIDVGNDSLLNATLHCKPACQFTYIIENEEVTITDCEESAAGELEIPATVEGLPVTAIGNQAFRNCTGLTKVVIPESVTSIGWEAFQNCTSLTEVNLPDGITDIQDLTFYRCASLKSITIPDSVTAIWLGAFCECTSLENIDFGNGVTIIGSDSFSSCASLKELVIPDSVVNIYEAAFAHNVNLSVVRMGLQVQYIAESAFYDCSALQDVYYEGTQKEWDAIAIDVGNDSLLNATLHCKLACQFTYIIENEEVTITDCDTSATGKLEIPETIEGYPVTAIGNRAFYNCTQLTNVVLPDGVISIGNGAFSGCWYLEEITIPDSVESIGFSAFYNCFNLKSFRVPVNIKSISNSMLEDCFTLEELILPDGLESIGYYAFSGCESLETVSIPNSVTDIQNSAFAKCYSLTSVTIPAGVTIIDYSVFEACQSLEFVKLPETVSEINMYAFDGCTALRNVYYNGNRSKWQTVSVGNHNSALSAAQLYCNPVTLVAEDALVVTEDGVATTVLVECGQVLDLNGCILKVDSLASFGQIIDSVGGGGLIVESIEITSNEWLPIQDESGCYRFYAYEVQNLGTKENADSVTFGFALDFADVAAYGELLKTGDAQVAVTLSWGENVKTLAFDRELIAKYVGLVEKYPHLRPYLKLTVTGLDTLPAGTKLWVIPTLIAAEGKLQNAAEGMEYIA